jgi:hypothetical protein
MSPSALDALEALRRYGDHDRAARPLSEVVLVRARRRLASTAAGER